MGVPGSGPDLPQESGLKFFLDAGEEGKQRNKA